MEGEHPVVLGPSMLEEGASDVMLLSRNFVPQSAQNAKSATLYTLDGDEAATQTVRGAQDPARARCVPRSCRTRAAPLHSASHGRARRPKRMQE
jgi:hypothetical protein